jgi:hypothetical protein
MLFIHTFQCFEVQTWSSLRDIIYVWPMQCIISYSLRELDTNYIYARGIFNVKFVNGLGLRVEG